MENCINMLLHLVTINKYTARKLLPVTFATKYWEQKKGLNSHQTKHVSNLNWFQCELCNNSYRCKSYLNRHFRTVHEEKKFTCALCSKTFLRKDILKVHYVKCKNKKEQKKEAEQKTLSKEFEELIKIPNDTFEHEFEDFVAQRKDNAKGQCEKYFKTKKSLAVHIREVHSNVNSRTCIFCSNTKVLYCLC